MRQRWRLSTGGFGGASPLMSGRMRRAAAVPSTGCLVLWCRKKVRTLRRCFSACVACVGLSHAVSHSLNSPLHGGMRGVARCDGLKTTLLPPNNKVGGRVPSHISSGGGVRYHINHRDIIEL